jgi:hypothetical protein
MAYNCEQLEALIGGLVDNELNEQENKIVNEHLETCHSCTGYYKSQKFVKSQLSERYRTEVTPVHLRARIRRDILETVSWPGFIASLAEVFAAHRVKSVFATLLLVLFITVPYGQYLSSTSETVINSDTRFVAVKGNILCVDCELLRISGHDPVCAADHRLGLKDRSGKVWNFVNASKGKELIHALTLLNQSVEVEGYSLPGAFSNSIDVKRFRKL